MIHARLFRILAVMALCLPSVTAQQSTSPTRSEADEALRQKAFELLESLAGQISILQSPENRARLAVNIADSLWERDERRARTLLVSVQNDINTGLQNQSGDRVADAQRRMVFLQLRINTVERIAKRDGELALSFFRATEAPPEPLRPENERYVMDTERAFELRLARQIAVNNPEVALNLARQSLAKGFSNDFLPLLRQLNRKHPEKASTLYGEIVAKLKSVNLLRDQNAFYFAQSLARAFLPPAADEAAFRDLMRLFINVAAANGCDQKLADDDRRRYFCYQIQSILPLMARVDPSRASTFGRTEEGPYVSYDSVYEELNEVAETGTVDDVLALTARYPRVAETIYWRAVTKAQASGDIERARKLANEYGGDPEMKRRLVELIDRAQKRNSDLLDQLKNLQATLEAMPSVEMKVALLFRAATVMAANDQNEAQKLRDQASALIDTMPPGRNHLEAQMALALAYCSEKNQRGLAIMDSLVPKLNELVSAAAELDGYENHHLRDGEWNMSNEGTMGALLTSLSENAAYFAWCDFDRAVNIAGQFERPEIRLMAQVKLAQGILAGRPKPKMNLLL